MSPTARKTAVILAGGVAKGAFEAGALSILADECFRVAQVVGSSSGSLNVTMYAAAVRAGRERDAARRLLSLWLDEADWMHAFHFSLRELLEGRAPRRDSPTFSPRASTTSGCAWSSVP